MNDTIHTYEFEYHNGDEWVDCQLYTSTRDDNKVRQVFIQQQQQDNEPYDNLQVQYLGEGKSNCGTDLETGMLLRVF